MNEDMEQCPFCGSKNLDVSISITKKGYGQKPSVYRASVFCKECYTYGPRVVCHSTEKHGYSDEEKEKFTIEAKQKWNLMLKNDTN